MATYKFASMAEFIEFQNGLSEDAVMGGSLDASVFPLVYIIPDQFKNEADSVKDLISAGAIQTPFDPSELESRIDAIEARDLGSKVAVLQAGMASVSRRVDLIEDEGFAVQIDDLEQNLNAGVQRIQALEDADFPGDISALRADVTSASSRVDSVESTATGERAALGAQIAAAVARIQTLEDEDFGSDLISLEIDAANLSMRVDGVESAAAADRAALSGQVTTAIDRVQALEDADFGAGIAALEARTTDLEGWRTLKASRETVIEYPFNKWFPDEQWRNAFNTAATPFVQADEGTWVAAVNLDGAGSGRPFAARLYQNGNRVAAINIDGHSKGGETLVAFPGLITISAGDSMRLELWHDVSGGGIVSGLVRMARIF